MADIRRNAVIMAAGTSSRFVPLSRECPKGLLEVKGEVLIERQIRQLKEAGIDEITIVTGYMADKFAYLAPKFGVEIVINDDYTRYNNSSSVAHVLDRLGNTYLCSSDNYFPSNVFTGDPRKSYYSALYAEGQTYEYCLHVNDADEITGVDIGGADSWYMIGHVYFSEDFSREFRKIFEEEYNNEETRLGYWEDLYIRHIDRLPPMSVRRYRPGEIVEFDTLDELREFDTSYLSDTRSTVIKKIAADLGCGEAELHAFAKLDGNDLTFSKGDCRYRFDNSSQTIQKI